ncbi:MAG: RsmB/NOP family class I SAM-dependent RNA methyltransferase [Candidatus Micrarchaeota archaeon]|nr:RsmB/NOP family class I SAM-dependent RNA methyltransferase [Candidatus Micrarchaeota archaeon]
MERKEFFDWLSTYTDAEKCLECFDHQKDFFRVNTLKITKEHFLEISKLKCEQSPTYDLAFEQKEQTQIGKTWEYFLGYIYPQSLPSILVSTILDPKPGETVGDVAAAPGSKFSHLAALMNNTGILFGNDQKEKLSALYATINRMNVLNCIVMFGDAVKMKLPFEFDKLLVDAPCTALGSGPEAYTRWDVSHSQKISFLQEKMLIRAFDNLKQGGELVYSTCTYAKEENEEVVKKLLEARSDNARLADINVEFPHAKGLSDYGSEFAKTIRIYPQHLNSEGFFVAKIKKL